MRRFFGFVVAALILSGCSGLTSHTEIEALNEAKAVGSPFTQRLTAEYRAYVQAKRRTLDYADARHFARKGLVAAQGDAVMPEPLSNWHLDDGSAKDLRKARNELVGLLDGGGRIKAPFEAAVAQFKFDCWIEQAEQNWVSPRAPACRGEYESAFADLKARVAKTTPKSEKIDAPIPVKEKPVVIENVEEPIAEKAPVIDPSAIASGLDEGMFLVFFDFDKSGLNATGKDVVDAVAAQITKRKDLKAVRLVGHTDSSGSDAYNMRLSARRAEAVRSALIERGVNADVLETLARGEADPMVSTPNNTREPANRRVEVTFE